MTRHRYLIGIDPGVKTGLAIYDRKAKELCRVQTTGIIEAMKTVLEYSGACELRFEDARQRKWFGKTGTEVWKGAGSIMRDCSVWEEFCAIHGIGFMMVAPQRGMTKWNPDYFKKITGWVGRTSEHSRDAAALVYGL